MLGGYSPLDGTVEFYGRINAVLRRDSVVLDLGAGRGAWFYEDQCGHHRELRAIRGKVAEYIGADLDQAVLQNPTTDRNVVITSGLIPLGDTSVDLIIADYVLEHIENVTQFRNELVRVLKPGGMFCARTPHALNYVCVAARMIRNVRHEHWLKWSQPYRKPEDVFTTVYRWNTLSSISREFRGWENYSYIYSAEPQYHFGSRFAFLFFSVLHRFAPKAFVGNIFVFVRKPSAPTSMD